MDDIKKLADKIAERIVAMRVPFSMDGPDILEHRGRFYINMGRPGFNTRANNRDGYATRVAATRAMDRCNGYGGNADSDNESKRHGGAW